MQVNNIQNNHQNFTAFKLLGGAEAQLKKVLKPKDWEEFNKIVDEQLPNSVNVNLFSYDRDKFFARIITNNDYVKDKEIYQYPFFESAVKFFSRAAKKADALLEKIKEMPEINQEEILNKMKG